MKSTENKHSKKNAILTLIGILLTVGIMYATKDSVGKQKRLEEERERQEAVREETFDYISTMSMTPEQARIYHIEKELKKINEKLNDF